MSETVPVKRRHLVRTLGAVAAALGIAALVAWPISAEASRESVTLSMDARPISCVGSAPVVQNDGGVYYATVPLTKVIDCTIRVLVHNAGALPVTIESATYRWLGPTGVTAHVDRVDSMSTRGNYSDGMYDGLDAVGHLQIPDIEPGETIVLVAHVERSKLTCYEGVGGGAYFFDSPLLAVSSLGITGSRSSGNVRFGFESTGDSFDAACDE